MLILAGKLHAEYFQPFPGFKELEKRATFVGIIEVERLDGEQDYYSISNFVVIRSRLVFKGHAIESEVARIADQRISTVINKDAIDQVLRWPDNHLIQPGESYLVFLNPIPKEASGGRYQWSDVRCEGTILPISPLTHLDELDVKKPMESFVKIVKDYSNYCDQMAASARKQKELIEKMTQEGK